MERRGVEPWYVSPRGINCTVSSQLLQNPESAHDRVAGLRQAEQREPSEPSLYRGPAAVDEKSMPRDQ